MFPVGDSFGRTELVLFLAEASCWTTPAAIDVLAALLATTCLRVLSVVKYSAEPNPVRRADGTVPRHRLYTGLGPVRIVRRTGRREEDRDCWTRVLRRSTGCRRTADETPLPKPATKWNVGCALLDFALASGCTVKTGCEVWFGSVLEGRFVAPWDIAGLADLACAVKILVR